MELYKGKYDCMSVGARWWNSKGLGLGGKKMHTLLEKHKVYYQNTLGTSKSSLRFSYYITRKKILIHFLRMTLIFCKIWELFRFGFPR